MEVHLCPASLVDGDLASNTARMFAVGFAPAMQVLRPSEFATPMRRANTNLLHSEKKRTIELLTRPHAACSGVTPHFVHVAFWACTHSTTFACYVPGT